MRIFVANLKRLYKLMSFDTRGFLDVSKPFFHAFKEITARCEIREAYLVELAKGKRVLHFGFLDVPFTEESITSGSLLHSRIGAEAKFTFGVDIDSDSLEKYRALTGDRNNAICDIQDDTFDPTNFEGGYDLVYLPEVLEHLPNPGLALKRLKTICEINNNARLCVTVPNAFFAMGFLAALEGNEIVHPTHYYYFSPQTLHKLLQDCGFGKVEMSFYVAKGSKECPGITKNGLIALCEI